MCMKKLVILSSEWKTREFCQAMMAIAIGPWLQFGMPHCPKNNLGVNLRIKTKHIQVEADATNSTFFLRWTYTIASAPAICLRIFRLFLGKYKCCYVICDK